MQLRERFASDILNRHPALRRVDRSYGSIELAAGDGPILRGLQLWKADQPGIHLAAHAQVLTLPSKYVYELSTGPFSFGSGEGVGEERALRSAAAAHRDVGVRAAHWRLQTLLTALESSRREAVALLEQRCIETLDGLGLGALA